MKFYPYFALIFATVLLVISCNKKQSEGNPLNPGSINQSVLGNEDTISPGATIFGKWNLILDSFFLADPPPFFSGSDSLYFGRVTDYYDFGTDSNLYRNEGPHRDTCLFAMLAHNQVNFSNILDYQFAEDSLQILITPRVNKFFTITTLTDHFLTFQPVLTSTILSPAGYLANKIRLQK